MSARLSALAASCRLVDATFTHLVQSLHSGLTEKQLAHQALTFFRRHQAVPAFPPIIAINSHSATPHHFPTATKIRSDDLVLIDIGCKFRGFCSDLTRVIFLGHPSPLHHLVYRLVAQAYAAAVACLRAGVNNHTVDAAARKVIAAAGYGQYFIHGTGHGVGRKIHQLPKIGPRAHSHKLRAGMAVTIEPGIYLPHRFGIRLEDTFLVTPTGHRRLTHTPLTVIP